MYHNKQPLNCCCCVSTASSRGVFVYITSEIPPAFKLQADPSRGSVGTGTVATACIYTCMQLDHACWQMQGLVCCKARDNCMRLLPKSLLL